MALHALKKITVRDVMKGEPEKEKLTITVPNAKGDGVETKEVMVAKPADLVVFYGRAINHRTGSTQLGEFVEYIGTFEARRIADGEVFQSTRLIPPPITNDLLGQAYLNAKRADESSAVDFAFVIGVEPDPNGAKGYKYTCKPVSTGSSDVDPLAELRSSLAMNFAETLGLDVMAKIGLPAPGEAAKQLEAPKSKKPEPA